MKKLLSLLTVALLLPLVMVAQTLAPNQKLLGHPYRIWLGNVDA